MQCTSYFHKIGADERVAIYPKYERLIHMYYERWEDMLGYEHKTH